MNSSTQQEIRRTRTTAEESAAFEFRSRSERVDHLLAKITGNAAISGANYRWEYDWERAEITGSRAFQVRASEPWYKGKALNTVEGGNTAALVMPGYTVANIPAGFAVKPIETGTYVLVFAQRDTDGGIRWVFSLNNAIDGTC